MSTKLPISNRWQNKGSGGASRLLKTFSAFAIASIFSAVALSGQAFIVNSPQEIGGGYEFAAAGFGRTLTDSVWTADGVFVNDGSAIPSESCNPLTNPGEIAGKIALIDRGSCEFGLKCLNAENAGAIAAVVINTAPGAGAIVMGAGLVGGQVTIPCVMIPYEVGQLIRNTMLNGQAVNISIGNLVPPPPPANDLVVANVNVLVPSMGIVPASQVREAGDFVFTPGASVTNRGLNIAPNYKIDVAIVHTPWGGPPTEVYSESFSSGDEIMPATTTDLVIFPDFDPVIAGTGAGIYDYSYTVSSDSIDNANFNNTASGSFTFSENLYSKATYDRNTGGPHLTATIGAGPIEWLTLLEIPYGEGYKIDSVTFDIRLTPSLAGIPLYSQVYQWNDANDDSILDEGELEIKGIGIYTFPEDETKDRVVLRLPYLDFDTFEEIGVVIPGNDMKYVVGVRYEGAEGVSLGFDSNISFERTFQWKTDNGTLTDLDIGVLDAVEYLSGLPVIATIQETFDRVDAKGIIFTSLISDVDEIAGVDEFEVNLFPNPVKGQLQVNVSFKEKAAFIEYYAFDAKGQLVLHKRSTDVFETVQAGFDTSGLPAGEYHLVVRTDLGIQARPFIVAR